MKPLVLPDGTTLTVRPIEPGDVDRLRRMFFRLSPTTVYRRFFSPVHAPPQRMLQHLATVDHDTREALVALDGDEIVAVARYDVPQASQASGHPVPEIAVTVEDAWQHRGLGRALTRRLAREALDHGFDQFVARMLPENRDALGLLHALSPHATVRFTDGGYEAAAPLRRAS